MKPYDHKKIEKKWQNVWDEKKVYKTLNAKQAKAKNLKPFYVLDMFPYPSGAGIHVGHPRGYIASDIFARMKRMQGFNVLHPMGWDSFGLPTEQYAIQTGKSPLKFADKLTKSYQKQLEMLGFSYDWDRQVATHDPEFYKWTQWIFLKIYNSHYNLAKNKAEPIEKLEKEFAKNGNEKIAAACNDTVKIFSAKEWKSFSEIEKQDVLMKYRLAYQGFAEVNWCAELGTVLANDEVIEKDGKMVSERGEFPVEKRSMRQWFMRITAYADRLIDALETLDWPNNIKEIQKNWIGKSEGSEITFAVIPANAGIQDFEIEFATENDASSIIEIVARGWLENNTNPETGFTKEFLEQERGYVFPIPKERIEKMRKKLSDNPNSHLVAKQNGKIVGVLGFGENKEKQIHFGVYVHPDVTGRGIGSQMMNYLFAKYPTKNFEIEVSQKNDRGLKLYKRLGFQIVEETKFFQKGVLDKFMPTYRMIRSQKITVFTTRADTLFGVTYVVVAPEHPLVAELKSQIENWDEVEKYLANVKSKSDEDRVAAKEKTGVELRGVFVVNPANGEQVPVWIADYVLGNYGTGAVMAVPAHDERDFEFAKKYNLPIKKVVSVNFRDEDLQNPMFTIQSASVSTFPLELEYDVWSGPGALIHSEEFSGMTTDVAKKKITEFVGGTFVTKYKMRDAIFARQRYWGEPIPLVHKHTPLKIFFLIESLEKNAHKKLEKLSVDTEKYEDWGMSYFVEAEKLDAFIKLAQKLLFVGPWYFDISGSRKLIGFKEKLFDFSIFGENEKAITFGKKLGIPNEQLDWKVEQPKDEDLIEPVPEKNLPLKLPNVKSYAPTGTGESPLASVASWVKSGYETNTMPGWAGSSWYFLRYLDPKNKKEFASETELDYWSKPLSLKPKTKNQKALVDMYVGGAEHATGHLLYARFWHKVLKDLGYVKPEEPFQALRNQGMIAGPDGRKMSKRWGNVINPDDVVRDLGADTLRVYESFMGPFEAHLPWSTDGIVGSRRFVEKVWKYFFIWKKNRDSDLKNGDTFYSRKSASPKIEKILHKTIKKVSEDIENFKFNTAISSLMIFLNEIMKQEDIVLPSGTKMESSQSVQLTDNQMKDFLKILAPFAPHVAEELYAQFPETKNQKPKSIHLSEWPNYDPKLIVEESVTIGVQVNGKVRATIELGLNEEEFVVREKVLAMDEVRKWMEGKAIRKFIYVKGKIVSIVV